MAEFVIHPNSSLIHLCNVSIHHISSMQYSLNMCSVKLKTNFFYFKILQPNILCSLLLPLSIKISTFTMLKHRKLLVFCILGDKRGNFLWFNITGTDDYYSYLKGTLPYLQSVVRKLPV